MLTPHEPSSELHAAATAAAIADAWPDVRELLAGETEAVRGEPALICLLAEAFLRTGAPQESRQCSELALPLLERRADRPLLRKIVNMIGAAQFELGMLPDAEVAFSRALELGRADRDELLVARAANNLGTIAGLQGRRHEAIAYFESAVPVYQRLGNARGLAETYHNMAIAYREEGQLSLADECEQRAIRYATDVGYARLAAAASVGRAEVLFARGNATVAEAIARRAAEVFEQVSDPLRRADALRLAGAAAGAVGAFDRALAVLTAALELARAHRAALPEAETLRDRAAVLERAGRAAEALADLRAAMPLFARIRNAPAERQALEESIDRIQRSSSEKPRLRTPTGHDR